MAVINLDGYVGGANGFQAFDLKAALSELGTYDTLYALLNSPGGSAYEAWIIYDYLKMGYPSKFASLVLITGRCSGEAILVALGFKQILMRPGSYIEFQPIKLVRAPAARQATSLVARFIAERAGCEIGEVRGWMDKNRRFTADECLDRYLCDAIV
jgi:ATP-dependent protease ClpP protease subunit